jgi:hypothetical protein
VYQCESEEEDTEGQVKAQPHLGPTQSPTGSRLHEPTPDTIGHCQTKKARCRDPISETKGITWIEATKKGHLNDYQESENEEGRRQDPAQDSSGESPT